MNDTLIYANGIDALTGEPLLPPLTVEVVAARAQDRPITPAALAELRQRLRVVQTKRGIMAGFDANDLAQAGWGVIFAAADRERIPALREALAPLLQARQEQAGARYRDETISPDFLYQPHESKLSWLQRNGGGPGRVDPRKLPYYLLIVGDPAEISYDFQCQLDLAHAVGRIHFDTLDEYASYASSVVAAEDPRQPRTLARQAAFFGVRNGPDQATQLSSGSLIAPLADSLGRQLGDWEVQHWQHAAANKDRLARLLGGEETPAFLFTASHGMGFPGSGHPRQRAEQGALICSDWPGQGIPRGRHFLAAEDIGSDAHLHGLIAFFFACYGAGTPQYDDFAIATRAKQGEWLGGLEQFDPIEIAPQPFVARLPQRLLGHPNGGALAVVGHVDRAWGSSFIWEGAQQVATFESALTRLFRGDRVGLVMEDFNDRYAELGAEVAERIKALKFHGIVPPAELAHLWTASSDARNYVVLGDPAVRLVGAAGHAAAAARRRGIQRLDDG